MFIDLFPIFSCTSQEFASYRKIYWLLVRLQKLSPQLRAEERGPPPESRAEPSGEAAQPSGEPTPLASAPHEGPQGLVVAILCPQAGGLRDLRLLRDLIDLDQCDLTV